VDFRKWEENVGISVMARQQSTFVVMAGLDPAIQAVALRFASN
jgi:hypothetical protein